MVDYGFAVLMLVQVIHGAPPDVQMEARGYYSMEECRETAEMFNRPEELAAMEQFTRQGKQIVYQRLTCLDIWDAEFKSYERMMQESKEAWEKREAGGK